MPGKPKSSNAEDAVGSAEGAEEGPTPCAERREKWGPRVLSSVITEIEQVHHVADGWAVQRNIWVAATGNRVREVVTAARGHWRQPPVRFDELQNRNVVGVLMRDVSSSGVRRHYDGGNPGAVTKVVQGLYVTRVVVSAAFIESDDDGGAVPQ